MYHNLFHMYVYGTYIYMNKCKYIFYIVYFPCNCTFQHTSCRTPICMLANLEEFRLTCLRDPSSGLYCLSSMSVTLETTSPHTPDCLQTSPRTPDCLQTSPHTPDCLQTSPRTPVCLQPTALSIGMFPPNKTVTPCWRYYSKQPLTFSTVSVCLMFMLGWYLLLCLKV